MKFLIVGLGNIGEQYEETRHNIGFMVIDSIIKYLHKTKINEKPSLENTDPSMVANLSRYAIYFKEKYKGKQIHLIKPTTFMNNSGKAVHYWMKELGIQTENILVVTDDISLPYGKIRLRTKGSSGGHNGLQSIENNLKTAKYPRLRVGIGDDFSKGRQDSYVLGRFTKDEMNNLFEILDKSTEACLSFIHHGISNTMNKYN